ncbi:NACHT, LRR and PYD domains-containing protein 3-like [Polypterus senegalus]|nr:NACHT, LRR and PYD domains-containing protein 3-like [Polypterus senegalus]XP_039608609.1 NACHT, LRR and PYD domains-containing protein 3-like [Polypterus senegalus]
MTHRRTPSESTKTSPGGPRTKDPGSEASVTEVLVIKPSRRAHVKSQPENTNTGGTRAELVEEGERANCERIWTEDLFRWAPGIESRPYIVVVSGVAGIGKSTMVQKVIFDWAKGTQYRRFTFVFLFKFRELNLIEEKDPKMSMTKLILRHYKHLNDEKQTIREVLQSPEYLLFILDGLDQYKHKLDFTRKKLCSNPDDSYPIHILITSLINRTLLNGCSILITSRQAALEPLEMAKVDRFTEVLGFSPQQRLTYFKKFFGDANLGAEAFQYVEESATLYTMSFNPSYCWIICSVLRNYFNLAEKDRGAAPRTVTELFVMFLYSILTHNKAESEDLRGILMNLGKMAFSGVEKGVLVFSEKQEIINFGLQPVLSTPSPSGFLKMILQKESTLENTTYTFIHLNMQDFMAACYFFLDPSGNIEELLGKLNSCKDDRFEILIRFLVGLSRTSVTQTLEGILGDFERKPGVRIMEWVKQKAERALRGRDKSESLRVCQWLYETRNKKLIRDAIGKDLKLNFSNTTLSSLDCAVLGSVINYCGELDDLNLSHTSLTPECIRRLAPGLRCSRRVELDSCELTSACCESLSTSLSAEHSHLTVLRLEGNKLEDSGVRLLCEGLRSPHCKLETLRLQSCGLTSRCCAALSSVIRTEHSLLTELWLGENILQDTGVRLLFEGLKNPNCKLKTLRLESCGLTSECCAVLCSALCLEHSCLTELWLRGNDLEDSGIHLLCEGLRNPNCKLERLRLWKCGLTSGSCEALSSALCSEYSRLTELWLDGNKLDDSGMQVLGKGLRNPNCKLEELRLSANRISENEKKNLKLLEVQLTGCGRRMKITT